MRAHQLLRAALLAAALHGAGPLHAAAILIGQVAPLTGGEALQGRAYATGLQLAFDAANKAGGSGHTFTLVTRDDGGRPADTVAATLELLVKERPLALAGYFGSFNVAELVKAGLLEKDKVALVGYRVTDLGLDAPYIYGVRAGLRDEIGRIAQHLATVGIKRLGLVYEDGPSAPALLAAFDDVTKQAGQTLVASGRYAAGTTQVERAVEAMLQRSPQAILMIASGAAAAAFVEQYRLDGGTAQLFAPSSIEIEQLSQRLGEQTVHGIAIAQVTPSPYRISSRLTKEFVAAAAARPQRDVPVSHAMMEGFIAGKVIVEAARRMGPRATREGFVAALDSLDALDLGGYRVGYRAGQRTGSRFVDLSIVTTGGRVMQ
jgi:branched-chain amino acid transport system substrate-binding protein